MTSGHKRVEIVWPDGQRSVSYKGEDWLAAARQAGVHVPTGCMGGSCGACEIDVDGTTVRACISSVPPSKSGELVVTFATDPYW